MKNYTFLFFFFLSLSANADDLLDSYTLEYKGKYGDAAALAEKLAKNEPSEYLFQLRAGWLSLLKADYVKSADYYRKAQGISPNSIEPKLGMIRVNFGLENYKEAVNVSRQILKTDSKHYTGRTSLAYALYQTGSYAEARKVYESVLLDYPSDVEMILGVGWTYLKEGNKKKSMDSFNKALKYSPQNPRAQEGLWYAGK